MKNNTPTIIVMIVTVGLLGFAVYRTIPNADEVTAKLEEITPVKERKEINTGILESSIISEIESLRIFGSRPVQANPDTLNRTDPFAGI